MNDDLPLWVKALEGLASEYGRATHPEAEVLAEYVEGGLPGEHAEEVRDHLTRCAECREIVLDLQSFPDLEAPSGRTTLDDAQMEEEWRALMGRRPSRAAKETEIPASDLQVPGAVVKAQRHGPPSWVTLLGASLVVACLGLLLWAVGERRARQELVGQVAAARAEVDRMKAQLGERVGGQLRNVRLVELPPAATTRGAETLRIAVPESAAGLVWMLDIVDLEVPPPELAHSQIEVLDSEATVRWSESDLREVEVGAFTFVTPAFPEGEYRIRLLSSTGLQLAEYRVNLDDEEPLEDGG